MKEKVRFVWENNIKTDIYVARKSRIYEKMKERYEKIREAIETMRRILEIAEKEEEFGVLEVETYGYSDVQMSWGILKFNIEEIARRTGMNKEEVKEKIQENWKEFIQGLIEFEQKQKEQMETYLKEAEPYLTVSLTEDEDED